MQLGRYAVWTALTDLSADDAVRHGIRPASEQPIAAVLVGRNEIHPFFVHDLPHELIKSLSVRVLDKLAEPRCPCARSRRLPEPCPPCRARLAS